MTTPQTTPELLPCPFCGGEPEIVNFSVHCNNAYCEAQPFTAGQFITEAITKWNTRAATQERAAPLEGVSAVYDGVTTHPEFAGAPESPQPLAPPAGQHHIADVGNMVQQDKGEATGDAETYLRGRYGAYRAHFAWRELEEASNAGAALPPGRGMVPMTDIQIEELWQGHLRTSWQTTLISPTLFARAIEAHHGIKEGS